MSTTTAYTVVDVRTDKVVFRTDSSVAAYEAADRMDARYGAVRYRVERDYDVMSAEEVRAFLNRNRRAA